jgi:predicted transcriptional regulator
MTKRNKLEIIKDILKIIKEDNSIKPTPLLRRSNLSSSRFKNYYLELLNKQFIKLNYRKNKKITLTEKGFRYLEKYSTIINFIDEFKL